MKKCPKCGVELPDEAAFCNNCGENLSAKPEEAQTEEKAEAPVVAPVSENNQVLENAKEENKNTKIGILAVGGFAAVLVLIILIVIISSASGSPKSVIKAQMKAFEKGDVKTMIYGSMPSKAVDSYLDDELDMTSKEFIELTQPIYDAMWDGLKSEGKVKFSYEIKKVENLDKLDKLKDDAKRLGYKDLDDFKDYVEDDFDDYDLDSDKISKAFFAEVKWEITVDGDKAVKKQTTFITIYKYKGKMYVYNGLPDFYEVYSNLDRDDYDDVIDDMKDAIEDLNDELY